MKKQIGILLIVMFLFGLVGCQNEEKRTNFFWSL